MHRVSVGRGLIAATAVATAVVPAAVDGWLLRRAHIGNPRWIPHARLHGGMSFFAAAGLGAGALALLATRPAEDRASTAVAAGLGTVFWAGLLASGLLPGASYSFAEGDPAFADVHPPAVGGVPLDPNVVLAGVCLVLGGAGFALARPGRGGAGDGAPEAVSR